MKRRVRYSVDDEEYALLERAAERHGLTVAGYSKLVALRAATESAWAEASSVDTEPGNKRALPTLPPPRSK